MFLDRPVIDWLLRHALRWHDCAWVVSEYSRNELLEYTPGKVTNIGEGISHAEYFHPLPEAERRKTASHQKRILFLGDTRPRKGMPDFLEAVDIVARQMPDIMLWIVSKEECTIDSQLNHQFFYRPARDKLANLYATCDVFVSASWWESFGLPPLEAMACGAPVVLTDSRGVKEFAVPGENCIMTPPKDPQALADGILQVLNDPDLSNQLRHNGPITASKFSWAAAVDRFETALQALLEDHR
jgi:glycosyltransferase involved in cell wall biosynthesis